MSPQQRRLPNACRRLSWHNVSRCLRVGMLCLLAAATLAAGCRTSSDTTVTTAGTHQTQPTTGPSSRSLTPQPTASASTSPPSPQPTASPDTYSVAAEPAGGTGDETGEGDGTPEQEPGISGPTQESPVGDTGDGDGTGALRTLWGLTWDGRGGLVVYPPDSVLHGPWIHMVSEVIDLCDRSAAYFAAHGKNLGPGEQPTDEEFMETEMLLSGYEIDCDTPGGNRYAYISVTGPSAIGPTVQAAIDKYERKHPRQKTEATLKQRPLGRLLGIAGYGVNANWLRRTFPLEERDEIVLLPETLSTKDGTARGMIHNLSETLYARNVSVSAAHDNSQRWQWPITVQPGETAPFEIENWTGPLRPDETSFQITANMTPDPDLTRSMSLFGSLTEEVNARYWRHLNEGREQVVEEHLLPDDEYAVFETYDIFAVPIAPDSPPGIDKDYLLDSLRFENPISFVAFFDYDGRVVEVDERPLFVLDPFEKLPPQPYNQYPTILEYEDQEPVTQYIGGTVFILQTGNWQYWFGGANPSQP